MIKKKKLLRLAPIVRVSPSILPRVSVSRLSPIERAAVQAAVRVRPNAYAPYSHYKVGVAVISQKGEIYTGVNMENCAYVVPHGEWLALGDMVKNGERRFKTLVCAAKHNGIPCLICRQFMREFSGKRLGKITVIGVAVYRNKVKGKVIRCKFSRIIGIDSFNPELMGVNPLNH